jgi:hypothetical protein
MISQGMVQILGDSAHVFSQIRKHCQVPSDSIVIDSRQYDVLGLLPGAQVEVQPVLIDLPYCTEITLSLTSRRALDAKKIAQALSQRIEDVEVYLDGVVLVIGQSIPLDELGVIVTPKQLNPMSIPLQAARVDWKRVMKIVLESDPKPIGFNLCSLIELGAASRKEDIVSCEETGLVDAPAISLARYNVALQLVSSLIRHQVSVTHSFLVRSSVFSEFVEEFPADEGEEHMQIVNSENSAGYLSHLRSWIESHLDFHAGKTTDLASALLRGIEDAKVMKSKSQLPVVVLLLSSGAYSHGKNPIPLVRKLLSETEGIYVACVGFGAHTDTTLLAAIAGETRGVMATISECIHISRAQDTILGWIQSEA